MKISILGVPIDKINMDEAAKRAEALFGYDGVSMIFTPNPEIIMLAQGNAKLQNALESADLCLPDGIGVVIASRIMKKPLQERVAGFDFLMKMMDKGYKTFLLGARGDVVKRAAERLENVVGFRDGYFGEDETESIIKQINDSKAEFLVVGLGAPKQELWIYENREKLACKVAMGVGGCIDVIAGEVKRAPKLWQKLCLEWLYRAVKEPKRFGRLMVLPKFIIQVIVNSE